MSNFTPEVIIDEVKNLISYSLINKDVDAHKFESLHNAVLKKYFDAKDIKINYISQTIDLKLPISNNNYTGITFECLDLNNFLQSCLKSDEKSLFFYQNLLTHYNIVVAA
ncbi:hypothetical protein FK178_10455 [Antarcticibacterium arcticum]|uniref:Uncharacterized protein n=1 Tax=Antarcticibacterium arcticum TaxID=2585771 RepID=A0A5B8YMR8_9FLAO|nr:hypothetical protein [Antarcticibacterium arcticum]QED38117.1 hypothetical protein FK178_10455 [Antarcticibacterium arcticum]